ncbi:MAG: S1 RNA-binding domain-containing protein [Dehalococcoidia bacterium]|nr:S1 RNA-binding domain-containing protein [Dehalococcoidia bacterium]
MASKFETLTDLAETPMGKLLTEVEFPKPLRRGDVLEVEIVKIDPEGFLVDSGHKSDALVPLRETRSMTTDEVAEIKVGDKLDVFVVRPDSGDQLPMLSFDRARAEHGWITLKKESELGNVVSGVIKSFNKGGAVVEVEGVQGFVPVSQLLTPFQMDTTESSSVNNDESRIGQSINMKIMTLDRNQKTLILSERQSIQEKQKLDLDKLLEEMKEGDIRDGKVTGISNFGAFVDCGGVTGLIHISEMSWDQVDSPGAILKAGQDVKVYVLKVDLETKKVAFSLRRLEAEPWSTVGDKYAVDQIVNGVVTKLADYGAFVRIDRSIYGLLHISEITEETIQHPKEILSENQELELKIISLEPEKRRLGLSLKQINQENSENMVEPNEDVQDNEVSDEIVSSTELEVDADSNVDEVISSDLTEDSNNEESVDEETGEETEENEDSI